MSPKDPQSLDRGVTKNARRGAKSRTGCQTCKVKRLKCDETKPACQNCVKRGLPCPGYKQVLRWSTKYEAALPTDGPSQKVVHPSVEYQFSAIDPSSFGESAPTNTDGGDEASPDGYPRPYGPPEAAPRRATTATVPVYAHGPQPPPARGSSADWPVDSGRSVRPAPPHGAHANSMVTFNRTSRDPGTVAKGHQQGQVGRRSSNSAETSAEWKALLRSYYRMSEPALPRSLHNEASALVEHYFRDVCVIFSAFDSAMNPFRTVIARLWDNSSSIFFAIQSMAAAHLANYMPHMRVTGLNMQQKAYECLQQELQLASINETMDDKLLLAVLLLGLTACWHDSSDLGVAHLTAARALIHPRLLREDSLQGSDSKRNDQFFAEALIYWEMCMAFVSQETFVPGMERRLPDSLFGGQEGFADRKIFPHPWTGIAPRIQMLFAEVGRLVRHYCTVRKSLFEFIEPPMIDMDVMVTAAKDLEEELLSICLPSAEDLVDVQDERTNRSDFIHIAEATKCAALLEIYRVFPEILTSRLGSTESTNPSATLFPLETSYSFGLDMEQTSWLTSLATHILDVLAKVPTSSGMRPHQLILLVTAAAELRLKGSLVASPGLSESTSYDLDVARARGFAMMRLNELASRLPSKPVIRIIQLVREVWRRNDAGEDVFWMDVMTANGWETIMG